MSDKKYSDPERYSDPENYLKMSEPFENAEAAEEALRGFYKELGELRKKYKLRDVLIVTNDSIKQDGGETGEIMQWTNFGNSKHTIHMAAYAFGAVKQEYDQLIQRFLKG